MNKKFVVIILVVLALTLSACGGGEQVASTQPATPPKNSKQQTKAAAAVQASATVDPNATPDPMIEYSSFATQTALAATGGTPDDNFTDDATPTPQVVVQPTLDPSFPTLTPNGPVVAQPTVQVVRPATYTLQKGEFIYCLARRFNVDVKETLALNGLFDSEIVNPGLTVRIPTSGSFSDGPRALRAHPGTYIVHSEDSIYSIACLYGDVDPMNIARANGMSAPYTLTVGAQIQIP